MGWYQSTIAEINFSKTSFHDEGDIQSEIDINKSIIERCKQDLIAYAISNPKDHQDKDETFADTISKITSEIRSLVEGITDAEYENCRLELLKENWDKRDGDYVKNPNIRQAYKKFVKEVMLPAIDWQEQVNRKYEDS